MKALTANSVCCFVRNLCFVKRPKFRRTKKNHYPKCKMFLLLWVLVMIWGHLITTYRIQWTENVFNHPHIFDQRTVCEDGYKIIHRGDFGLGHRLSKMSNSHHLAIRWQHELQSSLPKSRRIGLEIQWGRCDNVTAGTVGDVDIFEYLFGTTCVPLESESASTIPPLSYMKRGKQADDSKVLYIRNDVPGYFAGQSFKNANVTLTPDLIKRWDQKIQTDYQLFQWITNHFQFRSLAEDFQRENLWKMYHVVGLHLRIGNGEREHFVEAGRNNATESLGYLCDHLNTILQLTASVHAERPKPGLVFLATDTANWIPRVRACTDLLEVKLVTFPQPRLTAGHGVSYSTWTGGDQCFQGWKSSMMDVWLLSQVDILLAPTRSTFTQTLPLSLLLSDPNKSKEMKYRFCEGDGPFMTCFSSLESWLYRNEENHVLHSTATSFHGSPTYRSVHHKVMVHFPDRKDPPIYEQATRFWKTAMNNNDSSNLANKPSAATFRYGKRFNPEYRDFISFNINWTWEY